MYHACSSKIHGEVYYKNDVIRDVLLNGVADINIRREALGADGIQSKPTEVAPCLLYRKSRRTASPLPHQRNSVPSLADQSETALCSDCAKYLVVGIVAPMHNVRCSRVIKVALLVPLPRDPLIRTGLCCYQCLTKEV